MKDIEIIEAPEMPDHTQMLVRIPPKISISSFMDYLKGRSVTLIHEKNANWLHQKLFVNEHPLSWWIKLATHGY